MISDLFFTSNLVFLAVLVYSNASMRIDLRKTSNQNQQGVLS